MLWYLTSAIHHQVDYVMLPPTWAESSELVLAKVAGYDSLAFGLPNLTSPLLVAVPERSWLVVAATPLADARVRRFSPTARWQDVFATILAHVSTGNFTVTPGVPLWNASVAASWSSADVLSVEAEENAFDRGVSFFIASRLMLSGSAAGAYAALNCNTAHTQDCNKFIRREPPFRFDSGKGQLGLWEGFSSDISLDGSQPIALGLRHDCISEVSSSFALRSALQRRGAAAANDDRAIAINLLNYGMVHGGFAQPWVPAGGALANSRPWAVGGQAFGLMSWEESSTAYRLFYKDDNARALLAAITTAGLVGGARWNTLFAANVLGNLRVTGTNGFGMSSGAFSDLSAGGWRQIYDAPGKPEFSPHYVSYIWACYLWGFSVSGFAPLYERAEAGIRTMMQGYPHQWVPTQNGIAMQRARMILPLAFLVQVNGTAEHRQWLSTMIDGLLTRKSCTGPWCAFKEELSAPGWGGDTRVPNNADYGDFEAPLNQDNDDPVCDFLYTSNFALLGLHEAFAATGNVTFKKYEDALANFIVRVQARSKEHPELDGAFLRAFDFKKWEAWGSDADVGWGAWSIETGWTQSWITTVLGLRLLNSSVWDLGQIVDESIKNDFAALIDPMFTPPPPPPPPPSAPCIKHSDATPIQFELTTPLSALCAPSPHIAHVLYNGSLCGGTKIVWTAASTIDPRPGLKPHQCSWSRSNNPDDIPSFFGSCGVSASKVELPTHVCSDR